MSITEDAGTVGARLAAAREDLGLSVEEVSARTYIRPSVIVALEEGDVARCGGPAYARGHIRTLARVLHLDADVLLGQFDRGQRAADAARPPVPIQSLRQPRSAQPALPLAPASVESLALRAGAPPQRGPRWPFMVAALLGVICILALLELIAPRDRADDEVTPTTLPATPAPPPSAAPPPPAPPAAAPVVPHTRVDLRIAMRDGPSWLRVTDDVGRVLAARTFQPGEVAQFSAETRLRVTVGNAGAVDVSCNDRPLPRPGGPGEVVVLAFERGDMSCPVS